MSGGGNPGCGVDGRTEVALGPFLGLAGVDPDPQTQFDTTGPGFGRHLQLQLPGPRRRIIGSMERRAEGLTTRFTAARTMRSSWASLGLSPCS